MNGGNKIVGLRRQSEADEARTPVTDDELLLEEYYSSEFADQPSSAGWPSIARAALAGSAVIWALFNLWVIFGRGQPFPPVDAIPGVVATIAIPLVLIGTLYLLLIRNSHGESRRFQKAAESLRLESEALELKLSRIGTQLANAKAAMQEQALLLENYGAAASANMEASAKLIASSAAEAADHTVTAEKAGAELAGQMTELVRTLPSLQERATSMSAHLMESSQAMTGRIDSLERRLQAVMAISDDARLRTLSATKSLTTQLAQLQEETRSASDEINGMAEQAAQRIDVALNGARVALAETGAGLETQVASLNMLVERSRTAINGIGGEAVAGFQDHSQSIETRLLDLSRLLESHQEISSGLSDDLLGKLDIVEGRFGEFEKQGTARNERIAATLATVAAEAERMDRALTAGNSTAETLISRSESLLMALDSSVREIEETYPAALGRLDGRVEETRLLLASAQPEIEKLETIAQSVLGRTQETEELLRDQAKRLNELLETTGENLASNRSEVEMLRDMLYSADEGAARLRESAGPQLVAALVRVKDTADQAAERARQSLARAIPDAAEALGQASAEALKNAVSEQVTAQISQLSHVADQAIEAVSAATDRLDRKIQAVSESSNSIEQKIAQADEAVAARDREHYTRRSKDLIESLNSAAIDIAKVLSSDVTDLDWADYLKGDRGVFTRRAVRLLDAGEAREIALQYDSNAEFQDHVNRYIHDFEGMLRIILGARDGNALAVTLLSSDMGKLYVALAQAIDRLR
jgi:L-lactate utilization protein LutC